MGTLWGDLRYAIRMMAKAPAFTITVVLTLALGIGANTAIFSLVNALVLRPLSYHDADQLTMIWGTRSDRERDTVTPANFLDWREQSRAFTEMAAFSYVTFNLTGGGEPERLSGASVSTNFFHLLGISPALGRTFEQRGDGPESIRVVVLSNGLWQRRFGADSRIVGQTVNFDEHSYTVVGVMPPAFKWPVITPVSAHVVEETVDFWVPAPFKDIPQLGSRVDPDLAASRGASFMRVIGRLGPGITAAEAQAEMNTIAARLAQQYPDFNAGHGVALAPLHRQVVGDVSSSLLILLAAVVFVLAIACANVANLFLARAGGRRKEIAVLVALGAARWQVVRQLLTECVVLSLIAGAFGLLLAMWGVQVLIALSPGDIPLLDQVGMDQRVLAFTLAISLLTGLVFGLFPAIEASRTDLIETLKEAKKSMENRGRLRSLILIAELAFAFVLLVGTGLLLRSFLRLEQVAPGFGPDRLLTLKLSLPESGYREPEQKSAFFQQTLEQIWTLPGVQDAGAVLTLPLGGDDITFPALIKGRPVPAAGREDKLGYQVASPGYFRTMKIPLLSGRDLTPQDSAGRPGVVILNEAAARSFWPNENPIGRELKLGGASTPWLTVVGVVADVKDRRLDAEPRAEAYVSYLQYPFPFMDVVVRTKEDPLNVVPGVRRAIAQVNRNLPVSSIRTMNELLSESIAHARFISLLTGLFGLLALTLAAVGIYGVISYVVSQRTHEIGIRMALGAQRRDIFRLVVGRGMMMAATGLATGLLAGLALTRFISSFLFGVKTSDPLTFASVAVLLGAVAVLACYFPARRAAKVDPMVALRYE